MLLRRLAPRQRIDLERLRDAVHHVLAAIKNIDIFRKCETRQHGGGNDDVSIDCLGDLFEPRSDIEDIAQIGDLALARRFRAALPRPRCACCLAAAICCSSKA